MWISAIKPLREVFIVTFTSPLGYNAEIANAFLDYDTRDNESKIIYLCMFLRFALSSYPLIVKYPTYLCELMLCGGWLTNLKTATLHCMGVYAVPRFFLGLIAFSWEIALQRTCSSPPSVRWFHWCNAFQEKNILCPWTKYLFCWVKEIK